MLLTVAGWYAYKDYKFRNEFILRFFIAACARSVFALWIAFVILLAIPQLLLNITDYIFTLQLLGACLAITFFGWLISRSIQNRLYKVTHNNLRFDACALSVAYDKTTKMLRIASKAANYLGPVPMPNPFSFLDQYTKIPTNTYATTSRGESITIHGTGNYEQHTGVRVHINDMISNTAFIYNLYDWKGNSYTFSMKIALALNNVLTNIYDLHASDMAPVYKAEKIQQEELAKASAQQRKADEEAAKEAASQKILENVRNQCSKLLNDWGIDPEGAFKTYRYRDDDGGYICTMIAADKQGRGGAVLNDGKDTWSGSWKNAQVSEVGDTLEVQIDDPEYRKQNLKELRFVIKYMDREQRVEWIDRIRILSAQA